MRQAQKVLAISTNGQGLYDFSEHVQNFVSEHGIGLGSLTVFCQHTSCSLIIQENADVDVQRDMKEFFERMVPEGMEWLRHTLEGPDDMPAHIKTALTATSLNIPIADGRAMLGTWQGIYLFEHRTHAHDRNIVLHLCGE